MAALFGVVVADNFDELAVPRTARVGDDNFVVGTVSGAFAAETDGD